MTCNMTPKERSEQITSLYQNKKSFNYSSNDSNVALEWLIEEDPFYVCPDDFELDQRYGAASLSIALGLMNVQNMSHFQECDWEGIQCNDDSAIIAIGGGTLLSFYVTHYI